MYYCWSSSGEAALCFLSGCCISMTRIVLEAVPLASLLYCLIVGAHTLLESQFQGVTIVSKL